MICLVQYLYWEAATAAGYKHRVFEVQGLSFQREVQG